MYVLISVRLAGRLFICGKSVNVAIFSDAIKMDDFKICKVVVFIELYPFIPLSVTLIVFQGHSSVKQFSLENVCSYPTKLIMLKR